MVESLLDSDTYSEFVKEKDTVLLRNANSYLDQFGVLSISAVTVSEVVCGWARRANQTAIDRFLEIVESADVRVVDLRVAALAGQISGRLIGAGRTIGMNDCLIAATAIAHDLTLVTENTRHLERIQDLGYELDLDNWRDERV
jgi:predicted nucleic acid-binding protein